MEDMTLIAAKLCYVVSVFKVLEANDARICFFGASWQILELVSSYSTEGSCQHWCMLLEPLNSSFPFLPSWIEVDTAEDRYGAWSYEANKPFDKHLDVAHYHKDENHPPEHGDFVYLVFACNGIWWSYLDCGPNYDDGVRNAVNTDESKSTEHRVVDRIFAVVGEGADEDVSHNKEKVVDTDRNPSRVEITAAFFCHLRSWYWYRYNCR